MTTPDVESHTGYDYYESSGAPLLHYVDVLNEKKFKYRWRYAQHWLPHDVKHQELNTAMSRIETLRSLGVDPEVVPASPQAR